MIVNAIISVNLFNLVSLLILSKMLVVCDIKCIIFTQSLESLVSSDFSQWSEFHGALGYYLAIVFNLMDHVAQSIKLCDVLWWHYQISSMINYDTWTNSLHDDSVVLSSEVGVHFIEVSDPLWRYFRKRSKDEVV